MPSLRLDLSRALPGVTSKVAEKHHEHSCSDRNTNPQLVHCSSRVAYNMCECPNCNHHRLRPGGHSLQCCSDTFCHKKTCIIIMGAYVIKISGDEVKEYFRSKEHNPGENLATKDLHKRYFCKDPNECMGKHLLDPTLSAAEKHTCEHSPCHPHIGCCL